jgi:hypothetical protein
MGILEGKMIKLHSTNPITTYTFNATRKALFAQEDPNFDYTPGHYLPFPMAVVEVTSHETTSVDIFLNP